MHQGSKAKWFPSSLTPMHSWPVRPVSYVRPPTSAITICACVHLKPNALKRGGLCFAKAILEPSSLQSALPICGIWPVALTKRALMTPIPSYRNQHHVPYWYLSEALGLAFLGEKISVQLGKQIYKGHHTQSVFHLPNTKHFAGDRVPRTQQDRISTGH